MNKYEKYEQVGKRKKKYENVWQSMNKYEHVWKSAICRQGEGGGEPRFVLLFTTCLLLVSYFFTPTHLDPPFCIVSRGSRGPSRGSPSPHGVRSRKVQRVSQKVREFRKSLES